VVLGAGAGRRLAPLTRIRPKPLCPVGGVPLVDLALARATAALGPAARVAVNVHHGRSAMTAHLAGRVHLSVEAPAPLGTAGAIGALRGWLDGAAVLVVNGDTWSTADLAPYVASWDRERVRVVVAGPAELGPRSRIVASMLPWAVARDLAAEPTGLYEVCWAPAAAAGVLDVVGCDAPFVDCGTPRDYLVANLLASGGGSVIGEGATVEGRIERCVLWPGVRVRAGEVLVDAVRATDALTVLVRPGPRVGS